MSELSSSYNKFPSHLLPEGSSISTGEEIWALLAETATERNAHSPVIAIDAYPGSDVKGLIDQASSALKSYRVIDVEGAARSAVEIDEVISTTLTQDRVLGFMNEFDIATFFDPAALDAVHEDIASSRGGVVVTGWGAQLVAPEHGVLALADMARWEIQARYRSGGSNWRADNGSEDILRKYKRGYFVEWRSADRHKVALFDHVDFVIDANAAVNELRMIDGIAFRSALKHLTERPIRMVPFFDPSVWGGHWMKDNFSLDGDSGNYGWCFDCVPEENSLVLTDGKQFFEIPAIDLVLSEPKGLLGELTFERFGAEFPIRFDLLDTMGGGNLSLQVHPMPEYMLHNFGMPYTQDESYYILDADGDAVVYLGLKPEVDQSEMEQALRDSQDPEKPFDADKFINKFPVAKHDHLSIPAGTVHASGANTVVLEISATPYIFTFKLWDWARLGLDGLPRPVHLDHGINNIQWNRDSAWIESEILGKTEVISQDANVLEERTGLHPLQFIEVRRRWFDTAVHHDSRGTVNVLNLVEGDAVDVVSPTGMFEPFRVNYAETFIIPAAVGPYVIQPADSATSTNFATVKAYVRGTEVYPEP